MRSLSVKSIILAGAILLGGILAPAVPAYADSVGEVRKGVNAIGGNQNRTDLPKFIQTIINILLFIIGAVAVIMIIIGGIRYVTSAGDQNSVKAAKDTVLYSVIGLVITILAYAIVKFVIDKL